MFFLNQDHSFSINSDYIISMENVKDEIDALVMGEIEETYTIFAHMANGETIRIGTFENKELCEDIMIEILDEIELSYDPIRIKRLLACTTMDIYKREMGV